MKTIPSRPVALFVLTVSVLALATAYVAQYGFGLRPCVLCLAQRVPFALAGIVASLALLGPVGERLRRALLVIAGLAFLVNAGIAVYHVGVEQKWWVSSCVSTESGPVSVTDMAALMAKPVEARCDEPAWQWHGITMAAMNIPFSGGLALMVLVLTRRMRGRG
ncbi:MAG: disulfide bond formation protein B [Rhodospirillaceae bacterium]|nr:disulfide bond formation protein B [Rhodospirillales bacterium]